jgi:hypothetical protein
MRSNLTIAILLGTIFIANPVFATDASKTCAPTDTACLLPQLENLTGQISENDWRDQTYREVAKLYAAKGNTAQAITLVPKIKSDDTKALTIRGIGMAAAKLNLQPAELTKVFTELRTCADKIEQPASQAIALTYIAMSQAKARDDAGALATARSMTNSALRYKALGESAEIQANRGDLTAAMQSLNEIDDLSFRNKANAKVARAFADNKQFGNAIATANKIDTNVYEKSQAMLYILAKQITPDEITLGIKAKPGESEP